MHLTAYDNWNANAFADEPSRTAAAEEKDVEPASPDVFRSSQGHGALASLVVSPAEDEGTPTIAQRIKTSANVPSVVEKANIVDPLDAALSNVEEPTAHIPVFKRKLPLVTNERSNSSVEASPVVASPRDSREEAKPPIAAESSDEHQAGQKSPEAGPTPTAETIAATTPTLLHPEPPVAAEDIPPLVAATPANVLDLPVQTRPMLELPSSSPSTESLSGDTNTPPSRETSTSDVEGKSSLEKVAISPLERTPSMLPNPLDRNYSAPVSSELAGGVGGWGDSWNLGSGSADPFAYNPGQTESQSEPEPSQASTGGETSVAKQQEEEDVSSDVPN
jgi:hypothetical protein